MRLLLDTHVILAIIEKRLDRFSSAIQAVLTDAHHEFYVSVVSLWEMAIKMRLGKLQLRPSLEILPDLIVQTGIHLMPINEHHAVLAVHPEPATKDPFDRMLLAQAQVEGLRLVTVDRALVSHNLAVRVP